MTADTPATPAQKPVNLKRDLLRHVRHLYLLHRFYRGGKRLKPGWNTTLAGHVPKDLHLYHNFLSFHFNETAIVIRGYAALLRAADDDPSTLGVLFPALRGVTTGLDRYEE
jgi:hypothetical protein